MMQFHQLEGVENRFCEIEKQLLDENLAKNPLKLKKLYQEHANLVEIVQEYRNYKRLTSELEVHQEWLKEKDLELVALAREEIKRLEIDLETIKKKLQILLLPKDPYDDRNILLEIRAGTGGEEAALFVGELFEMYRRFGERQGWKIKLLSTHSIGIGGFKEIIAEIQGHQVYSRLKWEGGVHRVQRVPQTEAQGRIHTSAVTVAILPQASEVEVNIQPRELRVEVFRSGGCGGQSVNTTDSAVRLTHIPTGIVVSCQDERSQHKNKDKALKILRSRLLEKRKEEQMKLESSTRKSMVGTGDRSERIRTYNFPQGRCTDHRIGLTLYQLPEMMQGEIEPVLDALLTHFQAKALSEL